MRRTGSQYSSKKKKVKKIRLGVFITNMLLLMVMILIMNTLYKFIRLEFEFRSLNNENQRLLQEIDSLQEEIKATESPDFLEIMARQMNMVKDGEYVIIIPVEK